jgi:hypothetical protein
MGGMIFNLITEDLEEYTNLGLGLEEGQDIALAEAWASFLESFCNT